MAVYLVEETYELLEAIESDDPPAVCEELGDVLFHVLFMARMYEETARFDLERVAAGITAKMIRRHPHVFGSDSVDSAEEVKRKWRAIKRDEKRLAPGASLLDSVPANAPALMRAYRISERAAGIGFDWSDVNGVVDKVAEEWREFTSELDAAEGAVDRGNLALELGDILFTLVNVARFLGIHPETALAASTRKFEKRFRHMETAAGRTGRSLDTLSQAEMQRLWEDAKQALDPPESSPAP